jgi:hypothetical protein
MTIKITIKLATEPIEKSVKRLTKKALHSVGNVIVNQMVEFAHVDTGLLRNSIMYSLDTGESSNFGSEGTGKPETKDKISRPTKDNSLRAGSGLVYAGSQEKHNAWASKGFDLVRRNGSIERAVAKALKF